MADENRTTLANLAIALVRADPKTSDFGLAQRWVARVQNDGDLLNACLQQGANRAIALARDFIGREQKAEQRRIRQEKLGLVLSKAGREARGQAKALLGDERFKRFVDYIGDVRGRLR
jgi:hypothetical protein